METVMENRSKNGKGLSVRVNGMGGVSQPTNSFVPLDAREIYDLVPGAVIVMDTDHTILDLNSVAAKTAGRSQESCIGLKFWELFDNAACRAGTCAASEAVRTGRTCDGEAFPVVGGKELPSLVTAAPRFDDKGRVIGVVELVFPAEQDVNLARETERLALAAKDGRFEERIDEQNFQGRHLERARALNSMMDTVVRPLEGASALLRKMAVNDFGQKMEGDFSGVYRDFAASMNDVCAHVQHVVSTFHNISEGNLSELGEYKAIGRRSENDELVPSIIGVIESINALVYDAEMLSQAATEGKLSIRADVARHSGVYRKVIEGINETLDAVIKPVQEAGQALERIAQGDLMARVRGEYSGDHAAIKNSINRMGNQLSASMRVIGQNAYALASSSEELSAVSNQMSSNADETATQANVVSAAAEQVTKNLDTVATATEEMTDSIKEITKNAADAARVANSAVKSIESTNSTVTKLGKSSQEIGQIIKVITTIAQQTNLLSLNATIEAARAGEAGKGFAVVANEVKELARETARATEDITKKIVEIQTDTKGAVMAIGEIGDIVNQINDISNAIAGAVEEQTATTNEIAHNVAEAAQGGRQVAENISSVATTARNTTEGASNTQSAAAELSRMAAELQQLVAQFRVDESDGVRTAGTADTR